MDDDQSGWNEQPLLAQIFGIGQYSGRRRLGSEEKLVAKMKLTQLEY